MFFPKGSRIILGFKNFSSLICSATINLCSSLQIKIGAWIFSKFEILEIVFCNNDFLSSETTDKNCLGKLSLDNGHSLVPEPPQSITGTTDFEVIIFILFTFTNAYILT